MGPRRERATDCLIWRRTLTPRHSTRQRAKRTRLRAVDRGLSAGGRVEEGESGIVGSAPKPAGTDASTAPGATAEAPDDSADSLPRWFHAGRPPADAADICRFLASADADGMVGSPIAHVDASNACIALGDAVPQSGRQQELVCLAAAHVNCPRYLRGLLVEKTAPPAQRREVVSAPVVAATLVLLAALAASFGFLAVRGGFDVAMAEGSPRAAGGASVPLPSGTPSPTPTPPPTP